MQTYRLTHYSSHPECSGVPGDLKQCPKEIPQFLVDRWLPSKGIELVEATDGTAAAESTDADGSDATGGDGDTVPTRKTTGRRRKKAARRGNG